jgi:CRP-like cAMP-binding protein
MTPQRPMTWPSGNRLLDSLVPDERIRVGRELEEVSLRLKEPICAPGERMESVYFPSQAVVSVLARVQGTPGVEVATIGREGLVGVSLSWEATTLNPAELLQVQVPGTALRMEAEVFVAELAQNAGLARMVRSYTQAFVSQLCQQVACNGLHSIQERCARWMLLTHDRVAADEFPLTQGFLAQMLGVRRASVSAVAGALQEAGFIRYSRGRVIVLDRTGLEDASCECYQVLREVFDRLIP